MSERSSAPSARPMRSTAKRDVPTPEIAEFILFCHRRRPVGWPDIYDEMCAVAARREFRGWGQEELAERGLSFTLFDMTRLASWSRAVLDAPPTGAVDASSEGSATTPVLAPQPVPG